MLRQARAELVVQDRREDSVREPRPELVQDRRTRRVDLAVEIGIEPAAARGVPGVDHPRGSRRSLRSRSAGEDFPHHGPEAHHTQILGRGAVHHADDRAERVLATPLDPRPEKIDALDGAPGPLAVGG